MSQKDFLVIVKVWKTEETNHSISKTTRGIFMCMKTILGHSKYKCLKSKKHLLFLDLES